MSVSGMEESLYQKITEVIQEEYPGSIVSYWTAVVTVVTDTGTELVLTLDRPEQSLWQSMGLFKFVEEMRSAMIKDQVRDDRDDLED